ncbi:hypothetical protein LTR49_019453 [Elasticomyces elasticus]|nr:hypothetical protein LTR49_019453 [Elasticomyces elasticus]KAK5751766.1 hypothetical protein LTS12_018180 [Elasticomyces elasticus]
MSCNRPGHNPVPTVPPPGPSGTGGGWQREPIPHEDFANLEGGRETDMDNMVGIYVMRFVYGTTA